MPSGSVSGTGTWGPEAVAAYREIEIYFHSSSAGTTFNALVQTSPDNSQWFTRGSISQMVASGNQSVRLPDTIGKYIRVSYNAVGSWHMEVQAIAKT